MRVLTVNAGSTSVKLRVVAGGDAVEASADLGAPGPDLAQELDRFLDEAGPLDATAHRVVHGGPDHVRPAVVDPALRKALDGLAALAPLHNPPGLAALDEVRQVRPGLPAVVCFDTAFHSTMPEEAITYAIPSEWRRLGVRRYGFHGLSCAWATRRAGAMRDGVPGRLVVCHLGGGASVTAVAGGRSVATTMGFTPLAGLVMATRSGDVDPGALLWLLDRGVSPSALDDALEHRSGLFGLSGSSGDMRALLAARHAGDGAAGLAIDTYVHRLVGAIGSSAAVMGGIDCLVFTGGVGEHAAEVRRAACAPLGFLGIALAGGAEATEAPAGGDRRISVPGARVDVLVVAAREELQMAAEARAVLGDR